MAEPSGARNRSAGPDQAKLRVVVPQSDEERRQQIGRQIIEYAQLIQKMRSTPDGEPSRQPQSSRADQRPEGQALWDQMLQRRPPLRSTLFRCSVDTSQEGMTWQKARQFLEECLWTAHWDRE